MKTFSGAASVAMLLVVYALFPPQTDPAFMSLPIGLRLFVFIGLILIGVGAVLLFFYNFLRELS